MRSRQASLMGKPMASGLGRAISPTPTAAGNGVATNGRAGARGLGDGNGRSGRPGGGERLRLRRDEQGVYRRSGAGPQLAPVEAQRGVGRGGLKGEAPAEAGLTHLDRSVA